MNNTSMTETGVSALFLIFVLIRLTNNSNVSDINLCHTAEVDYYNYTEPKTEICGCEERHSCVRKCCQSGFQHIHEENPYNSYYLSMCIKNSSTNNNFTVPIYDGLREIYREDKFMVGMLDCQNEDWQYFKMINRDDRQKFYIQKNGSLYYHFYGLMYNNDRYCVDENDGITAFVCFTQKPAKMGPEVMTTAIAKLVTLPFLFITFIVYIMLPESSLHSRALLCHVLTLILGNGSLVIALYDGIYTDTSCELLGYSIVFFMLASFFWMNVICMDIWLTFSGLRGQINPEKTIFFLCCIYAWGMPSLMVVILFLMNTYADKNSVFYPGIGSQVCFISGNFQILFYYFGPILILAIINTILFILTTINIMKVKQETSMLKHSDSRRHMSNGDKKKFTLYWKLLFAMGINPVINTHVIQTLSWLVGWRYDQNAAKYIYKFKDIAHILYAIFIFITYVCKRKVWMDLKKRYYLFKGRPFLANSFPQTVLSSMSVSDGTNGQIANNKEGKIEEVF